jgi:photosystem II stability/assembly factor-like uncharacterized protein
MKIFIGTVKGFFVLSRRNGNWELGKPKFAGQTVYALKVIRDRIWAAPFNEWTGAQLSYSDDGGENWTLAPSLAFPADTETALEKVWQMTELAGRLFCGVQPAALFTSDDDGQSWNLCRGLWNHPHREQWQPGFGGLGLHTILPLAEKIWVAGISTGGVYRTEDGGETWSACNQKIAAPFLPEPLPEFGQCVHKIAVAPADTETMILQHHWGVYRSMDAGRSWENVGENKLPSDFGFAAVMNAPKTAFVIPIKADAERFFPDGKMRIYRTCDAGETWQALFNGLPQKDVFDCVLRDSFDAEGNCLAFGTTGGKVYFSADDGDYWQEVAGHLPRISCVRVLVDD